MHCTAANNKIVHNSIEHFFCNPSDFLSDDVLSCLWIVFTNSVFQVLPQKIVRWVEILGIGWPGVIGFLNRTDEHLRHNSPWDRLTLHQTDNPRPSYSQDLNPPDYFLRECLKDRVCENNPQTREDFIRRKITWIPQEMSIELWTILMLKLLLCCHTAVQCMEQT